MDYESAKTLKKVIAAKVASAAAELQRFPRGEMGITPDEVKASPDYRTAKAAYDSAFSAQRELNGAMNRLFKAEMAADRKRA